VKELHWSDLLKTLPMIDGKYNQLSVGSDGS
jgi:hypothetical protein